MTLLDLCEEHFDTRDLYEVLDVKSSASDSEVKNSYRRKALQVHPDKAEEDDKETATKKFQILSQVFSILGDKDKRAIYDESGIVSDTDAGDVDWDAYFRLLFPKLDIQKINDYLEKYRVVYVSVLDHSLVPGSEEEKTDLKDLYVKYEGDMTHIRQSMIGFEDESEARFIEIIEEMIEQGVVPKFRKFAKTAVAAKKKPKNSKARKPVQNPEAGEASLINAILQNRKHKEETFDTMMKGLEEKYTKKKKKKV